MILVFVEMRTVITIYISIHETQIHTRKRPDLIATVVDDKIVTYKGKRWRYNDWGMHVTGWSAINIYRQMMLTSSGESLDDLRKQLR